MAQNGAELNTSYSEAQSFAQEQQKLEAKIRSGGSWFFWIVALSGINTFIILLGGDWAFLIGLGLTQVAAAVSIEMGWSSSIALVVFLVFGGILALFGFFAIKRHSWAFIIGMILYALDGLLFLVVQDWLSLGFHALALFL